MGASRGASASPHCVTYSAVAVPVALKILGQGEADLFVVHVLESESGERARPPLAPHISTSTVCVATPKGSGRWILDLCAGVYTAIFNRLISGAISL